ncbi:MAG: acetyl-CoA acetyltransferase [Chloroflexi bacterium]|nr:acetyl-CoA acetyltransferase [Chloroflexota bacterium]
MWDLKDKHCIVGIGETEYSQASGRTTRAMAAEAVKRAMDDAGLAAADVDGLLSYHGNDSVSGVRVATDLGIRPNFFMDMSGGSNSTEALTAIAMGLVEHGMCKAVAVYRSMNGYTQVRIGGTGTRGAAPVSGDAVLERPYGWMTPAQRFSMFFMRHMYEYGTKPSQAAMVKVVQSRHASQNPKALMKKRVAVEDVLNSRWIVKPIHLLDCCLETDNSVCFIVTSADRARHLRQRPIYIMSVAPRVCKPHPEEYMQRGHLTETHGVVAREQVFGRAGVTPKDIDVMGCYDAFTWVTLLHLEDYGFCKKGDGGGYVTSGAIQLGGKCPINTSGGQLCEGYTHGISLVVENVRQLRGQADDYCHGWREGKHTYDYSEGHCRQVRDAEISMNMAGGTGSQGSSLILRR